MQNLDPNIPIILYGSETDQYRLVEAVEGPIIFRRKWAFHNVQDEKILYQLKLKIRNTNFIFFNHRAYLYAKRLMVKNRAYAPKLSNYTGNSTNIYEEFYEKISTFLQWIKIMMINTGKHRKAVIIIRRLSSEFHFPRALVLSGRVLINFFFESKMPQHIQTQLQTQCKIP